MTISIYLRAIGDRAARRAITAKESAEAAKQAERERKAAAARSKQELALEVYTAKRAATNAARRESRRKYMLEVYLNWWRSLDQAEKCRDWKLADIMPVFNADPVVPCKAYHAGQFLRSVGWEAIHIGKGPRSGRWWRPPEAHRSDWWRSQ